MEPLDPQTVTYVRRVNALPALTRTEELELAKRYLAGESEAGQRVVTANLRQ